MASPAGTNKFTPRKKEADLDNLSLEMGNKPPQALDFEEAVIGAMLVEPACVDDALGELSASCFYSPKLRTIYEAMAKLNEEHVNIDLLSVGQQLKKDKKLEEIGGPVALADLSNKIGAAAHIEYYINVLKQKSIQRKLITASYDILKESYDESVNVDDLIVTAQGKIFDAVQDSMYGEVESIGAVINTAISAIEERQKSGSQFTGVRTGFKTLDETTLGFQPSDLIILAARPSVGKTAFVMNVARNAAVDFNTPVAIFSLEMPAVQLATRLMISETGLDAAKLKGAKKMEPYEWAQMEIKLKALSKAPLYIDATPSLPIYEFRSKVKRLVTQKGVKMVIVDYLQLMQGPKELRGMREQEVAAISRTLKATAKELNIPIIALSQLSRQAVQRQTSNNRPQLSDLRESGSIEQDADMVMFIHRYDYQGMSENPEDKGKTSLIIAKHRNGSIGDIDLMFRSSEVKFVDMSDTLIAEAGVAMESAMNSSAAPTSSFVDDAPFPANDDFAGTSFDF